MNAEYYLCIDLKSFFASVECVERGLDPMTTNLVVADPARSSTTICLAVSPSMKALGVKNRCRVYEIPKRIDYIMATPRMQKYIDYSSMIYSVYLGFFASEDIHVYSIDEVFIYVSPYLNLYNTDAKSLAKLVMDAVFDKTGIRATCGIGTNLYLAKIALDIIAKSSPDFIGMLDEGSYTSILWDHKPLTDFWRIGRGISKRLARHYIFTMNDIAHADENLLYSIFGIDAELLIDHAWGREPVTISDIKAYEPKSSSLSSGQILMRDYNFTEGCLIVREMTDLLCLELVKKKLLTSSVTLYVGYSHALDIPASHGTIRLDTLTSSDIVIIPAVSDLYEQVTDPNLPIRRICISLNNTVPDCGFHQLTISQIVSNNDPVLKNRKIQEAVLQIKRRYGKNAVLKGMNLEEAATTKERNKQIGGHRSGT